MLIQEGSGNCEFVSAFAMAVMGRAHPSQTGTSPLVGDRIYNLQDCIASRGPLDECSEKINKSDDGRLIVKLLFIGEKTIKLPSCSKNSSHRPLGPYLHQYLQSSP